MKAYLYSNKGIFKLGPKVTTIGLNACDLILKNFSVEEQHAIIEFKSDGGSEGFFTILDFGSEHGTYLNGICLNPNIAVLLENHSSLQFGKDSTIFEFLVEHDNIKRAWKQNDDNNMLEEVGMHLPQLNTTIYKTLKSYSNIYKPPASRAMLPSANQTRPVSAEMHHRHAPSLNAKTKNCWLNSPSFMRSSSSSDLQYLEQKETQMDHFEDELRRLNHIEVESQKKDIIIGQLDQQITQLRQQKIGEHDNSIQDKLYYLEREVQSKKEEINILKNKAFRSNVNDYENNSAFRTTDIKENIQLKKKLETLEAEKEDLSLQISILRTTLITKDQEMDTLKNKIHDLNLLNESNENTNQNLNKELNELRSANDKLENKIKDLHSDKEIFLNDINMLKNENNKFSKEFSNFEQENEKLRLNISNLMIKNDEMINKISVLENDIFLLQNDLSNFNEKEDSVKIQLNKILKKDVNILEIPNILNNFYKENEKLLSELRNKDEMLDIDQSEIKSMNMFIEKASNILETKDSNEKICTNIRQLKENIQDNFSLFPYFQNFIVNMISCLNENEKKILNVFNKYKQNIEDNEDIWELFEAKFNDFEESRFKVNSLQNELKLAEEKILVEKNSLRDELSIKHAEEIYKIKNDDYLIKKNQELENNLHELQYKFDNISIKAQNDETNFQIENSNLLKQLSELNQLLSEKEFLLQQLTNENIDFSKTLDNLKLREADLVNRLRDQEDMDAVKMRVDLMEQELGERCEQIRQHALTICAMDEQINMAAVRANEYKEEIARLKTIISDLQNNGSKLHPIPPSRPRPLIHIATPVIRETSTHIQRENNDLLNKISEQQDIIQSLSKDLTAAQARLSDVHGEISEEQKLLIEENERKMLHRDVEIIELQQQMVQLTQLVDQLKAKLADAQQTAERLEREVITKSELVKRHEFANGELRNQLNKIQSENSVKITALEEQQKVSAELALQGASCRGDRHDVIMTRQREALTEMRAKIRALESGDIPLLSQDEAIQQIAYMKQELDELRNMQASRNKIEEKIKPEYNQSMKQLAETLQLSENNYLSLLRGVSSCLNIGEIDKFHTLLGLSNQEQMHLANERQQTLSQLIDVITNLKQRIHRKEELLQGYEKDLMQIKRSSSNGNIMNVNDKKYLPSNINTRMKSKETNKVNLFKHQKIGHGNTHIENDSSRNMNNHKRNSSRDSRPKEKKISFKLKEIDVV